MSDFLRNHIQIVFLRLRQFQGASQRKHTHFHRCEWISNAVGHSGSQLSDQRHFFRLKQGFAAFRKFGVSLIHIFNKIADAVA